MKKKLILACTIVTLSMNLLCGCGSTTEVQESTETANEPTETMAEETSTEAPHEHTYTEEVTVEATCTTEGEKTFTCECGDTYTEAIPATGHDFSNYVSNEDATYEADGTETATCSVCGETDTRVAEGSMLTYTFEDMDATKYAKSTVNVRSLPTTDGEKLGGLSSNDEVKVTGKCNETGWYRIEYSDSVAYVSDDYLVDNKVETKSAETSANNSGSTASASSEFPYELYKMYSNGSLAWMYMCDDYGYTDEYWNTWYAVQAYNRERYAVVNGQAPEFRAALQAETGQTNDWVATQWYDNGHRIDRYFCY